VLCLVLFKELCFENCSPFDNVVYYSKHIDCTNRFCGIVFFKQQHHDNKNFYFSVFETPVFTNYHLCCLI